jgi:hypothetical protein
MKSLFISIGAYSTALANVFQMNNFNPTTLIFWTTITGVFIWSVIGGLVGLLFFDVIGKFKNKWIGIGQIHSKD